MTLTDRLTRPILIHCCKDGTITYRTRREKIFNGVALPVFSVDTIEQAEALQVRFCRLQKVNHPLMPGKGWFTLNHFKSSIEDLDRISEMFQEWWERQQVD
jgi:hypothetical protein